MRTAYDLLRMALAQFAREYGVVRRAEGWGSHDAAYYRALPYEDLTRRFPDIWRIRARTFDMFVGAVLRPLEATHTGVNGATTSLKVLDLGAGSGWLAYRLARRGHQVVAIDLLDDPLDGLGAVRHFNAAFAAVRAEFDRLPLPANWANLVVFNAALHYSTDYAATLRESLRVLRPRGTLVILDSPMYTDPTSGARMVRERQARFQATYGFASDALPSEHFLTPERLSQLAAELGISWSIQIPSLDWRSRLSRTLGGLRARRQPATFAVIAGTVGVA